MLFDSIIFQNQGEFMSCTRFITSPLSSLVFMVVSVSGFHLTLMRILFCVGSFLSGISFNIEILPQFNLHKD